MCAVVSDPSGYLLLIGEGDEGIAVVERNIGHGTDFDARQRDVVADEDAARLGEPRLVLQRRGIGQQPFGLQADGDDQDGEHDAHEARPDEAWLRTVFQHYGSAHLPFSCLMKGKNEALP